jgi:hypothetical protein
MTAATLPTGQRPRADARAAAVPWRQLVRVTARQHRMTLLGTGLAIALLAIALLTTGVSLHEFAARRGASWLDATRAGHDYRLEMQAFAVILQFFPLLAGMFLGAPLIPREVDNGTAKLAWTQAASRTRWLLAQVMPVAFLLALAALGLSMEFGRWWLAPFPNFASAQQWSPLLFNLSPLTLGAWIAFAFALGLFLGVTIRRTLPAMAATFTCYGALFYAVSGSWRTHYLPPLRRALAVQFQAGGSGFSSGVWWSGHPLIMSQALGWPDGRLLRDAEQLRPAAWLNLHHIVMWVTYQPASRYHEFQFIELGWLIAASVLLLVATTVLIRRRPA